MTDLAYFLRDELWWYQGTRFEADSIQGKGHREVAIDILGDDGEGGVERATEVVRRWYAKKGLRTPDWLDYREGLTFSEFEALDPFKHRSFDQHEYDAAWEEMRSPELKAELRRYKDDPIDTLLARGAVRAVGNHFNVWTFDDAALEQIQAVIFDSLESYMDPDDPAEGSIMIEEAKIGGVVWTVDLDAVLNEKHARAVRRAAGLHANGREYEYGLTLRPVSTATVPDGFVRFGKDPRYPHGTVVYAKPLSKALVESFDLSPLDPLDPINVRKRYQAFRDAMYAKFAESDGLELKGPDGDWVSLTYSTRQGVEFQLTYWTSDNTPTGHIDFNDFEEAMRALWGWNLSANRRPQK